MAELPNYNFFFPTLNACLNFLAFVCLSLGFYYIKQRELKKHEFVMKAALALSALFLTSYLWYHFHYDSPKFAGQGVIRVIYFAMLISHIVLAVLQLPFIIWLSLEAFKGNFLKHARIARRVWPVWIYVSLTGVLVYLFVYIWFVSPELKASGILP